MKLALVAILTLVAFAAGLFGMTKLLPQPPNPEAEAAAADSLTAAQLLQDVAGTAADSLIQLSLPEASLDSLALLREQLALAQTQIPALLGRLTSLEEELQGQADRKARAEALSGTLSRLEDGELRALLMQLDADVLTDLYTEASPRNRTKLLQALPARRGAALVERIASGDRRPIPVEVPSAAAPATTLPAAEGAPAASEGTPLTSEPMSSPVTTASAN